MPLTPEDKLTQWLRRRVARRGADLLGDDAAFLPGRQSAVTVDQHLEGVHFPSGLPPAVVGRRLVAVNLSDVAAIGGRPRYGFLTVAASPEYPTKALLAVVEKELWRHGALLAGGDLARSDKLAMSLTLIADRFPRSRWVRRDSARPGDRLWVGGTVGDSALGRLLLAGGARFESGRADLGPFQSLDPKAARLARRSIRRHLSPEPQLDLGEWLARRRRAAAIDISDGLLLDLERMCRASGVGARLDTALLPLGGHFEECAAQIDADPVELALSGGEDYVLLFSLPRGSSPPTDLGATIIGSIKEKGGIEIAGSALPQYAGWDHFSDR